MPEHLWGNVVEFVSDEKIDGLPHTTIRVYLTIESADYKTPQPHEKIVSAFMAPGNPLTGTRESAEKLFNRLRPKIVGCAAGVAAIV
jgi:hypothetical protein